MSLDECEEGAIEFAGFGFEESYGDIDPCGAELGDALAGDCGEGVLHGDDDFCESSGDDRLSAWGSFAVMAAGFEGDVESTAACAVGGLTEGVDFGVRSAEAFVAALSDDVTCGIEDDGSDHGVRLDGPLSGGGEFECSPHVCGGIGSVGARFHNGAG